MSWSTYQNISGKWVITVKTDDAMKEEAFYKYAWIHPRYNHEWCCCRCAALKLLSSFFLIRALEILRCELNPPLKPHRVERRIQFGWVRLKFAAFFESRGNMIYFLNIFCLEEACFKLLLGFEYSAILVATLLCMHINSSGLLFCPYSALLSDLSLSTRCPLVNLSSWRQTQWDGKRLTRQRLSLGVCSPDTRSPHSQYSISANVSRLRENQNSRRIKHGNKFVGASVHFFNWWEREVHTCLIFLIN